jgi:uncharacterized membrane protein
MKCTWFDLVGDGVKQVIRRVVALHGVLSFFFNLTILALTVNMISNVI